MNLYERRKKKVFEIQKKQFKFFCFCQIKKKMFFAFNMVKKMEKIGKKKAITTVCGSRNDIDPVVLTATVKLKFYCFSLFSFYASYFLLFKNKITLLLTALGSLSTYLMRRFVKIIRRLLKFVNTMYLFICVLIIFSYFIIKFKPHRVVSLVYIN